MGKMLKRTWAQVNLDSVSHNYKLIRSLLKPKTKICCVIKADAYGHGAVELAKEYEVLGADWFAVSNFDEAVQLRKANIQCPILILGYTPPDMAPELCKYDITQAIIDAEYGEKLSQEAAKAAVTVHAHIKLDTGMSRVGFFYQEPECNDASLQEIEKVCRLPALQVEGIFTHFAVADEGKDGDAFTRKQFGNFTTAISKLAARGITFKIHHCANSAAILDYPEMQLDMVRPGIILYGLNPSAKIRHKQNLVPVMELKSTVAMVKTVPSGTTVSYGRQFCSKEPVKVATIPIGYADGYPRTLCSHADMLVHGKRAKIIGRICMDQLMLDVSHIPDVKAGDTVTVFGTDGSACITTDELAKYLGTIHYEVVCNLSKRVTRVYFRGGVKVGQLNYLW